MRNAYRSLGFLALWIGIQACAPPRVDFRAVKRSYKESHYDDVQKRWSRTAPLYKGVYSILFVGATYKSWDWRQAYVAIYSQRYALTPKERSKLEQDERADHDASHEFFVSIAPAKRQYADLDDPKSIWHIALINERGEQVHPTKVAKFRRNNLDVDVFFPFHTPFAEAYLVRFPKKLPDGRPIITGASKRMTFRIAGAPGRTDLVWLSRDAK